MPLHWHKEWELIRVNRGVINFKINGEEYEALQGDVLLLRGGLLHGANSLGCEYECLNFGLHELVLNVLSVREVMRRFYRNKYLPQILFKADNSCICDICNDIFSAFNSTHSEEFRRLSTLGNINRLFAEIFEQSYYTNDSEEIDGNSDKIDLLKPVLEYIEMHFHEDITLDGLAEIVGMNSNYFCRFFKSHTQKTPMNYVSYYRIEQAANMLLATDMSVTDVAFRCGFNDTGYFIKTFKKIKNCTPKQFKAGS